MAGQTGLFKTAWEDKFRVPTLQELLGHFHDKQIGQLFEAARGELLACGRAAEGGLAGSGAISEAIAWTGVPWRWTMVYTCDSPAHALLGLQPSHAWAYLVPDPVKVQICIPMSIPLIQMLPARRLKKFIRDGIIHARAVAGVHWPCYEVTARAQLDDIVDLAQRKYRALTSQPDAVAAPA
jgi:hypothetical protein